MKRDTCGRPSLFSPKTVAITHSRVTAECAKGMKITKRRMSELTGWPVTRISVGDVQEFLVRGEKGSVDYWKTQGVI